AAMLAPAPVAEAAQAHGSPAADAGYKDAQAQYQSTLATAAAAQREYEGEIARWRAAVKACRTGDYARCGE
ncbi:MAG: hypothetical protein ABW042_00975, partial [Phenylobacterium sp.]